jgi:hypothetical protein
MDDNVERLARKKMKNDAMKRAFAVNGQYEICRRYYSQSDPNKTNRLRPNEKGIGYLCILLSGRRSS